MPAAGVVMVVAVVLIVGAVVFYLVSTIVALRKITKDLDQAISGVLGIIEKSAPVGDVVNTINANLDAGVDLLEGLLVKKAGLQDAVGLLDGLYPGAAAAGLRNFPDSAATRAPRAIRANCSSRWRRARRSCCEANGSMRSSRARSPSSIA